MGKIWAICQMDRWPVFLDPNSQPFLRNAKLNLTVWVLNCQISTCRLHSCLCSNLSIYLSSMMLLNYRFSLLFNSGHAHRISSPCFSIYFKFTSSVHSYSTRQSCNRNLYVVLVIPPNMANTFPKIHWSSSLKFLAYKYS